MENKTKTLVIMAVIIAILVSGIAGYFLYLEAHTKGEEQGRIELMQEQLFNRKIVLWNGSNEIHNDWGNFCSGLFGGQA